MQRSPKHLSLTKKDLHCITRILQGCLFMDSLFWGCGHCRYADDCMIDCGTHRRSNFAAVREKLTNLTGVYIGALMNTFEEQENVKCHPASIIPHKALCKVVKIISEYAIVINAGSEDSIQVGQPLEIFTPGQDVIDPETGMKLGVLDYIKARLTVKDVFPRMCICVNQEKEKIPPFLRDTPINRTLPLPIDAKELSGGFDGVQKKIQVGDLVRLNTIPFQQGKEKSENTAPSLNYINAAITLKDVKEINEYLAAGWKIAHIFRGEGRMMLVRVAEI